MKPDWKIDLSICTGGCTVERIGRNPRDGNGAEEAALVVMKPQASGTEPFA